jgi:hypothetical protein
MSATHRRLHGMPLPLLIALVLFLVAYVSDSRADSVGLNLVSAHSRNPGNRFSDINPGVYYKHASGFGGGVFNNSYRRTTFHVDYTTPEWHYLSLTAGVASGYADSLVLAGMASVRIPIYSSYSLRLGYVPASWISASYPDVTTLMVEREF